MTDQDEYNPNHVPVVKPQSGLTLRQMEVISQIVEAQSEVFRRIVEAFEALDVPPDSVDGETVLKALKGGFTVANGTLATQMVMHNTVFGEDDE